MKFSRKSKGTKKRTMRRRKGGTGSRSQNQTSRNSLAQQIASARSRLRHVSSPGHGPVCDKDYLTGHNLNICPHRSTCSEGGSHKIERAELTRSISGDAVIYHDKDGDHLISPMVLIGTYINPDTKKLYNANDAVFYCTKCLRIIASQKP